MSVFKEQEYNKRFDLALWQKLWHFCQPYKRVMLTMGGLMLLLAVSDIMFPLMSRYAIDKFIVPKDLNGIGKFALLYGALVIVQIVVVYFFIERAGKVETALSYDIRKAGFYHLQELSFDYYDKTPIGWLMARLTSDCRRLGGFISWGVIDLVWGFSLMLMIALVMLILNWKLALIALTVVPVLAIISYLFQTKILRAYRIVRKTNSKISASFNEGINGAKTTKTLVRESENLQEFQVNTDKMYASSVRAAILSSLYLPAVLTLGSIGTGLALWFGGERVVQNAISYGTLIAFISYTVQFFEPLRELARLFAESQNAQASAERIFSLIEEEPTIKDRSQISAEYGGVLNEKRENWPEIEGEITFQNVDFYYLEEEPILQDFNLSVKAGETIALVGETGSGKSTIVNLACRFYEPIKGKILIDGVDYRERSLLWLHSNLGYVLQTPHLFSGTIAENIAYGSKQAQREDVIRAAKLVKADHFISKLEKGYDAPVGEGGANLSTGEKQLISFARAIISDPKIFVLDEATSSVDTEAEMIIQATIDKVLHNRTSFIIAHRLSTIKAADRILVIRQGKIIESGDHKALLKKRGYYYELYTNQFIDEESKKA
ncbi:MAG: ABC transporter ATP-binding protein [Candidatus Cloacimonadales bacterium]